MGVISVTSLGEPRPASRDEEEIIAAALAGFPGTWRRVELGQIAATRGAAYPGFGARLGPAFDERVAANSESQSDDAVSVEDCDDIRLAERFGPAERFALRQEAPARRRIVRRMAASAPGVRRQAAETMADDATAFVDPAYGAPNGAFARRSEPIRAPAAPRATSKPDRSGLVFAILLMIGVWAGVVGGAAWFFNTPGSGVKIKWQ